MGNDKFKTKKIIYAVLILIFLAAAVFWPSRGKNDSYFSAEVLAITQTDEKQEIFGDDAAVFDVELKLLSGKYKNKIIYTEHYILSGSPITNLKIDKGDKVTAFVYYEDGELKAGIEDYYKSGKISALLIFFVIVIFLVTGLNGLKSLLSLFITLILIFGVMPRLLFAGYSPVFLAVLFSFITAGLTVFIVYGINKKSAAALSGTLGGVITAGVLAHFSVKVMRLTGWVGSETLYLQNLAGNINLQGLLVCGIIIGALGAVMDVSVSIASSVFEINKAGESKDFKYLFKSGLKIGRDIIGTMTNTLVLAYAGSSFVLILLFSAQGSDFPLIKIINMEFITAEIVRAAAGSIGMVLAIPLTALAASLLYTYSHKNNS